MSKPVCRASFLLGKVAVRRCKEMDQAAIDLASITDRIVCDRPCEPTSFSPVSRREGARSRPVPIGFTRLLVARDGKRVRLLNARGATERLLQQQSAEHRLRQLNQRWL